MRSLILPSAGQDNKPVREVWVAQALIKACSPGETEPVYLVQRDGDCRDEYRLIGGRLEECDGGLLETMRRELEEELGLERGYDYTLHELIHELLMPARMSPTFGVLSAYCYRIYGVKILTAASFERSVNKWVTKREFLAGHADSGERIAAWHAQAIDSRLPDGLDGVRLSLWEKPNDG